MKRRSLIYSFLILFCFLNGSFVFAKPFSVSFFTDDRPQISLTQYFEYNFMHGAKYENSGFSTVAALDADELLVIGGFNANTKATDIAFQAYYAPCFWDLVSIGVSAKYHYYKYSDNFAGLNEELFSEHNLLPGAFISFNLNDIWKLYFNAGGLYKFTVFPDYPRNAHMNDNTLFFNTGCIFTPTDNWRFFIDFGNCSLFDDCLLGNFKFDLGFSYRVWQRLWFGSELIFGWTDASIPHDSFSHLGFRTSWGVKF